jgi:hypothetical protein
VPAWRAIGLCGHNRATNVSPKGDTSAGPVSPRLLRDYGAQPASDPATAITAASGAAEVSERFRSWLTVSRG